MEIIRDYQKNPIQYIIGKGCYEPIPYDDLYHLYIDELQSLENIANYMGVSRKYVKKYIDIYQLKRTITKSELMKKTNYEKYGVSSYKQVHFGEEVCKIIENKDLLKHYIESKHISSGTELGLMLGISPFVARRLIVKYHLKSSLNHYSMAEKELQNYLKGIEIISNDRTVLNGKEIDIYIPSKRIGIEFNGNYWHNERRIDSLYHQQKSKMAEEKGIFLYHIFEYEWNTKKEQILNQINNLLGLNKVKLYARKCVIKEVSNQEKSLFLELNHLQGNDRSSIKLGLYYQDELVSIMTFCKPRFNKNYEYELSRFCSKAGCNVIGGASRLFKAFIKTYNPKSIISYSNVAHTSGKMYETLGMKLDKISEPNYVWHKSETILTRYQCQKHKLLEQGFEGKSEVDIMHKMGYYRIYDCGNKVWSWKRG